MRRSLSLRSMLKVSYIFAATSLSAVVAAQTVEPSGQSRVISSDLPAQLPEVTEEQTTGPDGVETIIRTRRIPARAATSAASSQASQAIGTPPNTAPAYPVPAYQVAPVATQVVFQREQWINECKRRTAGRSVDDRGQLIGALLGAAAGGIAGNRIADGERLGGTLIGAGAGGLAGAALGNAISDRDEASAYDCEAALDQHLSQFTAPTGRIAARTIPYGAAYQPYPAQGYVPYPAQYQPYPYQQPPQVVLVPVQIEQPQRVVVRETVREERLPATRTIDRPQRVPLPTNSKLIRE